MSHPHDSHKQHKVEKSRVSHITRGYATGGAVHSDEKEDKKLVRKMVKKRALKVEGEDVKHRQDRPGRKRGGRAPKGGKTVINVINGAGHAPQPGLAGPPPGMMPPGAPPAPPPPAPPMAGPPPGAPPMGARPPMGGLPMRKKGGRVTTTQKGTPVFEEGVRNATPISHDKGKNDLKDMNRPRVVTFNTGGGVKSFRAYGGRINAPQKKGSDKQIEAPKYRDGSMNRINAPQGVAAATKLPGGAGGGEGRLAKSRRASRD